MLWEGDGVLVRTVDEQDLVAASQQVLALCRAVRAATMPEVVDVVPAARTVTTLLSDPPSEALRDLLTRNPDVDAQVPGAHHEIPVTYDGADLGDVNGLSPEQVVALHTSVTYTVAFIGFSPGFPYLLGLPAELHAPRLATPRARVPAGSVGVGGEFTGIYPSEGPGGWLLLGRTAFSLFDTATGATLAPGDTVGFVPAGPP